MLMHGSLKKIRQDRKHIIHSLRIEVLLHMIMWRRLYVEGVTPL